MKEIFVPGMFDPKAAEIKVPVTKIYEPSGAVRRDFKSGAILFQKPKVDTGEGKQ